MCVYVNVCVPVCVFALHVGYYKNGLRLKSLMPLGKQLMRKASHSSLSHGSNSEGEIRAIYLTASFIFILSVVCYLPDLFSEHLQ